MDFYKKIIQYARLRKKDLISFPFLDNYRFYSKNNNTQYHKLNAMRFLIIESPKDLCLFFKIHIYKLEEIINNSEYRQYKISKKKSGLRIINEPNYYLKKMQKRLNYYFQAYYLMIKPKEVFGFVINPHYKKSYCNIAENAKRHIKKKYVLNIDIADFFNSITAKQVHNVFTEYFQFNYQIATALTLLTTYKGRLPTGAPTSPVISNFVCINLDLNIRNFCEANNITYSRYADDLTFSANKPIATDDILDIISIILNSGFKINEKKLRLKSSNKRQTVTGLTVNDKVNINRPLLKKIRAMLNDLVKNGYYEASRKHFKINSTVSTEHVQKFLLRLDAYINFIGQIRGKSDKLYLKQKKMFNDYLKKNVEKK